MTTPTGDLRARLLADLDLIWHSVGDNKDTNAAYERLKAALSALPAAGGGDEVAPAAPTDTPADGGEGK